MLMLDESEKSTVGLDAQKRPGSESRNMEPDMCLKKEYDEEQEEFCGDDGCDKDTKDEGKQEQSSSDKEDESKWTDEEAMDWEFFLNNHPHNPFYSSCTTGFKTNSAETQQQNCAISTPSSVKRSRSEDVVQRPKKNIKKGPSRQVRFNEEVTVHLVECDSATRAARDGSCWMQLATDRLRFRRRVEIIREMLSPFLTAQH